jgi:hypothetical protein
MPSGQPGNMIPGANRLGRPKGSKDKIARSVKASVRLACEGIGKQHPQLIKQRILDGIQAKDLRVAFPYIQLVAHYVDGKPKETLDVRSSAPLFALPNAAWVAVGPLALPEST